MNTTIVVMLFCLLCSGVSAQEIPKNHPINPEKTDLAQAENPSKTSHAISINGEKNLVKIEKENMKKDSVLTSLLIDVNGTQNSVKIGEAVGKIVVKQTGHNNQATVTQKPIKTPTKTQLQKYKPTTKEMKRSPPE